VTAVTVIRAHPQKRQEPRKELVGMGFHHASDRSTVNDFASASSSAASPSIAEMGFGKNRPTSTVSNFQTISSAPNPLIMMTRTSARMALSSVLGRRNVCLVGGAPPRSGHGATIVYAEVRNVSS
jgi:hypothetical protein